jgi:hypothetical protein
MANFMFNFGMLGAAALLLIALIGYSMGGR